MSVTLALAGNPNCGKTTMFNALTGASQYVGNWPGVTVEKKEGKLKGHKDVVVTDLPGIYSLSPYTTEEVISRNYLLKEHPDVVVNLVDASNIERNLYLTTQVVEMGLPVVIALNMMDVVKKRGDKLDITKLEKELGCKIVETAAVNGTGLKEMSEAAIQAAQAGKPAVPRHRFSDRVESALADVLGVIGSDVAEGQRRWYSIKAFERDERALESLELTAEQQAKLEEIITACETDLDDDAESIITNERYDYISKVVKNCVRKKETGLSISDKIDRIVTNRILALPIFVVVIALVYYITVSTVGGWATDWANDGLLGEDGWFLLGIGRSAYDDAAGEFEEADALINGMDYYDFDVEAIAHSDGYIEQAVSAGYTFDYDEDAYEDEDAAAEGFGAAAEALAAEIEAAGGFTAEVDLYDLESMEVDETVTVDLAAFEEALAIEEPDPADYSSVYIPGITAVIANLLESVNCNEVLSGLILDGIVAGVGAVLGFVPQMLVLFLFLAILEDCGYMARIAFIMDRIFRRFGLSGKSFIPLLIGTGCGIPGVMATRTIENERDRRMGIMTTTFMPCGAKLPIIALIAGALFNNAGWVATASYFIGIAAVVITGVMLKKTKPFAGEPAPFVMELPAYHLPRVKGVLIHMWDRAKSFIKKAGTIILLATILVWFLSSFGFQDGSFGMVDQDVSLLAGLGGIFAWLFKPLGFGNWRAAAAVITGLIAKENVVGTFGVLYAGLEEVSESGFETWTLLRAEYTQLSAFSFLVFNLLCAPCFAAIGAMKREFGNIKWTLAAVGYQCLLAWCASLVIYQLGGLIANIATQGQAGVAFNFFTVVAVAVVAFMIYMLVRRGHQSDSEKLAKTAAANAQ